jgi:hypothetical protein
LLAAERGYRHALRCPLLAKHGAALEVAANGRSQQNRGPHARHSQLDRETMVRRAGAYATPTRPSCVLRDGLGDGAAGRGGQVYVGTAGVTAQTKGLPWEDASLETIFPGWPDRPNSAGISAAYQVGQAMTSE